MRACFLASTAAPMSIPGYVEAARFAADGALTRLENANGTVTTRRAGERKRGRGLPRC